MSPPELSIPAGVPAFGSHEHGFILSYHVMQS